MSARVGSRLPVSSREYGMPVRSTPVDSSLDSLYRYVSKLVDYRQMDFETTLDQMKALARCEAAPVYKTSFYRKQQKDHWARDDPAFVVLQVLLLLGAACFYSAAFAVQLHGFSLQNWMLLCIQAVFLDWMLFGMVAATVGWHLANTYLNTSLGGAVPEKVEWLYAFDVHCNSFVPRFILLYVVPFVFMPFAGPTSVTMKIIMNMLAALAFSIYFYIMHLGYRTLPFLVKTEVYLYPIAGIVALLLLSVLAECFGYDLSAPAVFTPFRFD